MRRLTAHYIFPVNTPPIKHGILELSDNGKILNIDGPFQDPKESANLEHYSGVLVPGFVNAHCHLELSHLKGKIPQKGGLHSFVANMIDLNASFPSAQPSVLQAADRQMYAKGIVAVGDIANGQASLAIKERSNIRYHTFLEVLEQGRSLQQVAEYYEDLLRCFSLQNLSVSYSPHSAYALKPETINWLLSAAPERPISIHSQESKSEDLLLKEGSGLLKATLIEKGIPMEKFQAPGKNALQYFSSLLKDYRRKTLFVHNTYAHTEEMKQVQQDLSDTTFVTCPNSNCYIEDTLPQLDKWYEAGINVAVGTDSLASNQTLDILAELYTIQRTYPQIPFEHLLQWATLNGASALELGDELGSFEIGKCPGVNLITGFDVRTFELRDNYKVRRLI